MADALPQATPPSEPAAPYQPTIIPPTRVEPALADLSQKPVVTPPGKPGEDRPAWLPPKFKSPEDMAKAYGELEKKMGGKAPEAKPADSKPDATKPADDLQIKAMEKQAEAQGIDLAPFTEEFGNDGKLSDKSYEALANKGIPKEIVDTYIQGQLALQDQAVNELTKDFGGREGYAKMADWAAANVPKAELDAYNRIVTSTDKEAAKIALQGLHSRYSKSIEPNFLRAGQERIVSGDVFRSTAELTAAMRDPRYKSDPAYRADVEQKLGRSNII